MSIFPVSICSVSTRARDEAQRKPSAAVLVSAPTNCSSNYFTEPAKMRPLGWWLMLVGFLRLASVWFGFFNIWALRLAVFSQTQMTDVHGRTFGVWTLLTCTLCWLCAFNLENRPLYIATFLSFVYAFGHFLTEYLIYHTMAASNLTTVGVFAGTSIVWMLLQWNAYQPRSARKPETKRK